jgi:hypothetical protein
MLTDFHWLSICKKASKGALFLTTSSFEGAAKTAADFQLVGYVFLLIAMWFLCGILSIPFMKSLSDLPPSSPVAIMVYLVLAWLFLFLSHWKSAQATGK